MSVYLGENLVSGIATPVEGARNIGQIIQSTIPLSDAGLHLLDGALINGTGSYSAFVTYIAGLVSNYPDLFITETAWQQAVTDYGVCGKFVYDSTNNTVRLPKITGFTEGTIDPTVLGNLTEAGLPNITGQTPQLATHTNSASLALIDGAFSISSDRPVIRGWSGADANEFFSYDFDASLSNPIYGNSSTVQPQTIKVLYYIVIANSVKTNIEVDIDEIATDLNGKADVDLSNVLPNIDYVVEYQMPTSENSYKWYRKYKSGWLEQGGNVTNGAVTFLKEFSDTNYQVYTGNTTNSTSGGTATYNDISHWSNAITNKSTTGCNIRGSGFWEAKGQGARQ